LINESTVMHEMSIAQNIMDLCLEEGKKAKAEKIIKINIRIGRLTGIVSDSLTFCFDIMKEGTIADNAEMMIITNPVRLRCKKCETEYVVDDLPWMCANCDSLRYSIISGNEFYIESIELE